MSSSQGSDAEVAADDEAMAELGRPGEKLIPGEQLTEGLAGPARILMVLDVDGTVSRVYGEAEREMNRQLNVDAPYLPLDDAVINSLNLQAQRPGVHVGWLTSWAHTQADVDRLVSKHLDGRLDGSLVPWTTGRTRGLRLRSLLEHLREAQPDAVIWVDDYAPSNAARRIGAVTDAPRLVIKPELHTGITHSHVERVRSFINALNPDDGGWAAFRAAQMDRDIGPTLEKLADR